ncbi:MAG: response regulator [Anaerolineae bacterium]
MGNRILIVDDGVMLLEFLQELVEQELPGCQVDAARSGKEALIYLAQSRYDLVLAELYLIDMSGLKLLRNFRSLDPRVPIVIMTAYCDPSIRKEAEPLGNIYYLGKPFALEELFGLFNQLLFCPESEVDV